MKVLPVLIIPFLFWGCSSLQSKGNKFLHELSDIYTWINLMPGGTPGFHITGRLDIYSLDDVSIPSIASMNIVVTQNGRTLFEFTPGYEYSTKKKDGVTAHLFNFHTLKRLPVTKLDIEKDISIKCIFLIDDVEYSTVKDSIIINKVY